MADTKKKLKSWQFNAAAIALLVVAFCGYAVVSRIGASSGTVIPYYPADCSTAAATEHFTGAQAQNFLNAYRSGSQASIELNFFCGGSSAMDGGYSVSNHITTTNQVIRDRISYAASASTGSMVDTTCTVSYSGSDDDRMGDRFVLMDCGRAMFKLSYTGLLSPSAVK